MKYIVLLFGFLSFVQGASAQIVMQPFTGVVSAFNNSGGPGFWGAPVGTQVSGTFTVGVGGLGTPVISSATFNEWLQNLAPGDPVPNGINPNNTDSISVTSPLDPKNPFTASNLQSVLLSTTGYDLQWSGGPFAPGPGGGIAIACFQGGPPLPVSLSAFPLGIPNGCTAQVTLYYNLNQYFMTIDLTSLNSPPTGLVVANFNGGTDQTAPIGAGTPVTAHFPLGSNFQVGYQDKNGNGVQATFSVSGDSVLGNLDKGSLFAGIVAFKYINSQPNRCWFQAAHEGTTTLTITPTSNSSLPPVSISIVIGDPAALGDSHAEVDSIISPVANRTGIPPQLIKAQMAQESSSLFNPLAFRYEPLAPYVGDYGSISRNMDLRAHLFSTYRFATVADSLDPALAQGSLVDAADVATKDFFLACCGSIPTALSIVSSRDSSQHWTTQGSRARKNNQALLNDDFTAQTSLASSYGYLQVTYVTAVTRLKWTGISGFMNPSLLFDSSTNLLTGGGSVNLGATYIERCFAQKNPDKTTSPDSAFTDPDDFVQAFYSSWKSYNGSASYPPKVAHKVSSYLPTQTVSIF